MTDPVRRNSLLKALPPEERRALAPHLETVHLARGTVLAEAGAVLGYVHFPHDGVVSSTLTMREGGTTEIATIGREGMVGFFAVLGDHQAIARNMVQIPGPALRLPFEALQDAFEASPRIRQICLRYVAALVAHILQSAACNARHDVEARLARWLLLLQDRIDGVAALPLTQELVAEKLGVQRTTITMAAQALQRAGLIAYKWGSVTVLDRAGLEQAACECYGAIRTRYERLLARPHG